MSRNEDIEKSIQVGLEKLRIEEIRPNQRIVIMSYLKGNDVLFCSPTGSGKSLTFEIAPFAYKELNNTNKATVIVVSPLVALMKNQNEKAQRLGMKSVYLRDVLETCKVKSSEDVLVSSVELLNIQELKDGEANLIFTSPESILGKYRELVTDLDRNDYLKAIFIDEAHCIAKFGTPCEGKDAFRPSYGCLGELRSLSRAPVIALTATASKSTQTQIMKSLCMTKCDKVLVSPNKENIKYWLCDASGNVVRDFAWLTDVIRESGTDTPRIIIFFRQTSQISRLYAHLAYNLKDKAYVNFKPDGRNDDRNRLFDMFHKSTDGSVKESICDAYMDPHNFKRVLLVSTSFSMGLDVQGVHHIIHYGPANNVEDYMQETGRAGRNSQEQSHAILMKYKHCLSGNRNIDKHMRNYCKQIICRRIQLLQHFVTSPVSSSPRHTCCDICSRTCRCFVPAGIRYFNNS